MKKDILTLSELSKADFESLFKRAYELKERHKKGITEDCLKGKTLGLLFDKPSTRTRISFETAMAQLGGTPIFINAKDTQITRGEPVKDVARVFSRYLDGLVIRTYSQKLIDEFAEFSVIPVINALSDLYHPCQVLSDLMTVFEHKGRDKDLKITWVGDGNNVAHSWINAASVLGLNLVLACPQGYFPDSAIVKKAVETKCGQITVTSDPGEAVKDADVIYTDVWVSMGQDEDDTKKQIFEPFQVNSELVNKASKEVIVMHCLPAHREEEITEAVLEGPNSVVWDQAENKLHMHKAVLEALITKGNS
ncbi:ornithine carbamoyltransferase [Desulfonema magnum]|uniref:Ornithine carbamoyltransferase n=1 Tax=Desulfonema magnum TaxID=45655 RepID=A0A975BUW1_9BACT|nr:ornithine carbamoyltransferase [Desulfonema magnum]QTA91659.1 Ornithine carbamoyltransferase [Desulfonema magnum]